MGYRFTIGRMALGILMMLQGALSIQSGFKEQITQFKELRSYLNTQGKEQRLWSSLARATGGAMSDQTLNLLVYLQAFMALAAGSLMIANYRFGGLLLALCMCLSVATRDNPLLAPTEYQFYGNLQNMLKDLAVAGLGLLFLTRRQSVKHRKR